MDRLKERLQVAGKALATFCELPLTDADDDVVRDASIQRFEYTFEAIWKTAQLFLREREGLVAGSPKGVMRACLQVGLLTEDQVRLALEMADDRNLTAHTYNEELARKIFSRLAGYASLLQTWLNSMTKIKS